MSEWFKCECFVFFVSLEATLSVSRQQLRVVQGIRFALFILFLCVTLKCCLFALSPPSPVIKILVRNVHFHDCVHLSRCPLHKGLRSFMITELSSTPKPSQSSQQCTVRGAAKGCCMSIRHTFRTSSTVCQDMRRI